ncbi:hypothetical protein ABZ436_24125 [Micromonospora matsumotoense]|uniref:hypothetical protein n=1 Tax=Micromonospora matsumotoense TaxID=121616 RepID=UPI0034040187
MGDSDSGTEEEWSHSADPMATFPPTNVQIDDLDDLERWARMDPPGWRRIKAAVNGGSAIESEAGHTYAATLVNYQTLIEAANAFQRSYNLLHWLETFVSVHAAAIAGEGKPWQGKAAKAFLAKMDYFSRYLGEQADRLLGGDGVPGSASVPQQLMMSGSYLKWAQEQLDYLDVEWAKIAAAHEANHTAGGNVAISSTPYARPMTDQMLQVAQVLAKQYAQFNFGSVSAPEGDGSLGPGDPTRPKDLPTEPPTKRPPPTEPPTRRPDPTEPPTRRPDPTEPPTRRPEPTEPPARRPDPKAAPPPDGSMPNPRPDGPPPSAGPPPGAGPPVGPPPRSKLSGDPPGGAPIGTGPPGGGGLPGFDPPVVGDPPGSGPGGGNAPGGIVPPAIPGPPNAGKPGGIPPPVPPVVRRPDDGTTPPARPPGGADPPGGVTPPSGIDPPSGVSPPSGIDPPGGISPPGGIDPPGGISPPGGIDPPGGVSPPSGIDPPGGVSPPGGIDPPGGVSPPSGIDPPGGVSPPGGIDPPGGGQTPGGGSPLPGAPMPGMPGSPGSGPGGGSGVERPDSSGLVDGDPEDWLSDGRMPGEPSAPGGAVPGNGGIRVPQPGLVPGGQPPGGGVPGGGVPPMPGAPGSPGAGAGGGATPERPDAAGLVDGDESDWLSSTDGVGLPSAPGGAAAGGPGLGGRPGPGAAPPEAAPLPVAGPVPAAGPPPMPGVPGSPGAGAGGGTTPERPDAAGLVEGDVADWEIPGSRSSVGPEAPGGTPAGASPRHASAAEPVLAATAVSGAGTSMLPLPPWPPAAGGRSRTPAPRPTTAGPVAADGRDSGDAVLAAGAGAPEGGSDRDGTDPAVAVTVVGVPLPVPAAVDEEREPVDRPDAADLLRAEESTWTGVEPPDDTRVPIVRPAEQGVDTSGWDDSADAWWLSGDGQGPERTTDA